MKKIINILFYFSLLFIPLKGFCNDTIYFSNQSNIDIVDKISVFSDSSLQVSIQDLLNSKNKYQFEKCGIDDIHVPFDSPHLWFKCTIKNTSKISQQLNLELENATIYQVQFYTVNKGIYSASKEMGIKHPFNDRPIKTNTFVHRFSINSGATTDIYFQMTTKGDVLNIPVKLYNNDTFDKKIVTQSTMLGIIIGFIIALIMIAFYSLYLSDNEFTYLYFALYSIFGGLWILNNDGFTFKYLFYNLPTVYIIAVKLVPLLAIYLFSQFGIRYLNIKETFNTFYRIIYSYNWILLFTILIMPFSIIPQSLIVEIETFEIVTVTIMNLFAALYTIKRNRNGTMYYLIANIILILGILSVSFNIVFGFTTVEIRGTIMKVGLLFQMTVLLFALTNKIRNIQKNAEMLLKDSKQKYFDILENAIEAIFIIQDKKIKFSNTQLSILSKYRVNELVNFNVLDIVHEEDKARIESLLSQQSRGNSSGKKVVFRSVDKEKYENWMEMISVPIMWEQKPASLNFMNDISQRILSEKEKQLLEKQLLHAQKMETIGTLAGGIAHDFNNILTPIIGYSEILLETIKDEDQKDDILNIKTSAYRAKELVSQILRFSHQIDSTREHVNVNKIIKEVTKLLEAVIPSSITFKTILYSEDLYVNINPTQLHQVIMNLCTNAYQSITLLKGKITLTVSIADDLSELPIIKDVTELKYVKITIADNGSGIAPEIKTKIFDPFFTTKKVGEGTGLGLSVVYGIVKNNGGTIICNSELGVGTQFEILLPLCDEVSTVKTQKIKLQRGKNEEILIVDDEVKIAVMLKKLIETEGYIVTIENSSIQALENIKKNPTKYSLLISDITMPELTGIELAKLAMECNNNLKFIFVTGHITQSYSETIKEIPNSKLILKPIDFSLLHNAINEHLNS
jgi:PAS domain S-box-containing protein